MVIAKIRKANFIENTESQTYFVSICLAATTKLMAYNSNRAGIGNQESYYYFIVASILMHFICAG